MEGNFFFPLSLALLPQDLIDFDLTVSRLVVVSLLKRPR